MNIALIGFIMQIVWYCISGFFFLYKFTTFFSRLYSIFSNIFTFIVWICKKNRQVSLSEDEVYHQPPQGFYNNLKYRFSLFFNNSYKRIYSVNSPINLMDSENASSRPELHRLSVYQNYVPHYQENMFYQQSQPIYDVANQQPQQIYNVENQHYPLNYNRNHQSQGYYNDIEEDDNLVPSGLFIDDKNIPFPNQYRNI